MSDRLRLLTIVEKAKIAEDNPVIDLSFEDDYKWEVFALLDAQDTKSYQAGVEDERKQIAAWMIWPCHEHSSGGVMSRRECPECVKAKFQDWGV